VTVTVDGKAYKTVALFLGKATVKLSPTLAVGAHAVVAQYLGTSTALPETSASETLTVTKATTIITLSKVLSTTLAADVTGTGHSKSSGPSVQVKVHIVGSKRAAKGTIVITVNGKKVRTLSLAAARSGKLVVTLPKFSKTSGKVTVRAMFKGSKTLKSAKSKKLVITLP